MRATLVSDFPAVRAGVAFLRAIRICYEKKARQ